MKCHFCGKTIEPYQPGTTLFENLNGEDVSGVAHTQCLYAFGHGENVPEILQ